MQAAGAQAELFFWLTVEGYRVTAQQQLEVMQSWQKDGQKQPSTTKGLLKAAALGVYEQYLSEKVGGVFNTTAECVSRWPTLLFFKNLLYMIIFAFSSCSNRRLPECRWTRR